MGLHNIKLELTVLAGESTHLDLGKTLGFLGWFYSRPYVNGRHTLLKYIKEKEPFRNFLSLFSVTRITKLMAA